MNKRIKATIALLVIISIIMPFIPVKAIAFNAEDRPYYAEVQLRGVTDIDNDNHRIECGNGEVHYATITVEDENAILEENEGNYFLYTQESNLGFSFVVEEGYTAFTRVDGAQQPSEVNENYYNMEQLEMDHNYNLDFEFSEVNNNPGGNQGNNDSFIEVSFDTGDINENVATFNVDDEEITVTISGAEMNGGSVLVDRSNMSGVTFTLSNNFNRETMQVIIRGADQYNAIVEPDEYGVATLNGLNIPDGGVILGIEHKGNGGGGNFQEIPAPELETGYLVTSMVAEDGTNGGVTYYFVDTNGKYLEADGTVINEQQQPAGTIMSGDDVQKVAIPENAVKVKIGLYTDENTDAYMTMLYHNESIENVNKDNVKYGSITIDYAEGDSIGFSVGFNYCGEPAYVPENQGTYMIPFFPEDTEDVEILYSDVNGDNQTINYESGGHEIEMNRYRVTLQIPQGKMGSIHVEVYDENMQHLDGDAGDIHKLLNDEQNSEKNFDSWMGEIIQGNESTLDLSGLNADYTYLFNVSILDPHEAEKAHVLSWSNVIRPNDNNDLLIDGGFAQLVQALDEDGHEIWNINEEYDDSSYLFDEHGNKTSKFIYGDEIGYEWERGPMYPFAIDQNDDGGEVEAIEGIQLVFEFIPVYGKQLTHISLDSVEENSDAQNTAKYYKVVMPPRHTHFNAQFEEIEDKKLIGEDTSVTDMQYVLEEGSLNSGTAVLSIDTVNDLSDEQKEGFADVVGNDYEVSTYLDVDLTQVWFKGTNAVFGEEGYSQDDVWTNEIYDLGDKKATITVTLDAGVTPDDIVILHEVHDDEGNIVGYEKVKIINKEQDVNGIWTVTFETSRFSNYAIAEKKEGTSATYEVTFETDGGTQIQSQEVASGETATKPEDPIKDGFSFGGWYADDTFAVEFDFDTPITQNATVYVKWVPDGSTVYTVTIVNEHGDNFEAQSVQYGTQIRQLSVYNYYTTVKQSETEGYGVLTIARKPLSEYTSTEAILADSIDADDNSIYDDAVKGDVTYYVIWFELIDEVEVEVAAPVCGTSTTTNKNGNNEWDVNSQTNGPQVTIPGNAKYQIGGTIDDQEFLGSAWVETSDNEEVTGPFIGTFEGGEKYNAYIMLTADFGYMFQRTNSSYYETISEVEATHNLTHVDAVDATCTTDGSKEYYECSGCDKKFVDSDASEEITDVTIPAGHDWNDWVVTKEATVDEAGSKTRTCKRDSSHTETEEIARLPYEVVEGKNQTIEAEEGEDLTVKANGSIDKFVKLLVDGVEIDPENYTVVSGSTIATLASSFLDTLSSGNHTLTFVYTDGQAQTNFRIARATDTDTGDTDTEDTTQESKTSDTTDNGTSTTTTKTSNPKTGDNIYKYVTMFTIATVGLMLTKKNKKITRNKGKH